MPLLFFNCPGFRVFFSLVYFFERTRPAASLPPSCLIYLSTGTGVRAGCHYLISLIVRVCVTFVVFTECESCTWPISTSSGSMESGEYGLTRGTCFVAPSRGGRGRRAAVDIVVCFGWV